MSARWVAASVRVRALAAGRAGEAGALRVAGAQSWREVHELLAKWSYGVRAADRTTPEGLQRATRETLLWQLRVLAGWCPATGTAILRIAAAQFERDNILMRRRELDGGRGEPPYELGALETAWSMLRQAETTDRLRELLGRTAWGEVPPEEESQLADILTSTWLLRCADAAPSSRAWAARSFATMIARLAFVERSRPGPTLRQRSGPLIGHGWEEATDLVDFVAALPRRVRTVFTDISSPSDLWRAEARMHRVMADEAAAMLRDGLAGPDVVVAGIALLTADAWRIQAAIAAVGAGEGAREVLDVAS